MFSLKGKTIIITGGSTHLGKAMSESVCKFGGNVVICSRNAERCNEFAAQLNRQYSVECIGTYLDFCDESSIMALVSMVIDKYNSIDVLINNASFSVPDYVENQSYEDFMKGLEGTIGGTFNVTSRVIKTMINQNHGNIISVSSMYGVVSPKPSLYEDTCEFPNPSNYGSGKAAIIQFTKYLACNYAKYNIRANCIVPGAFPNIETQNNTRFIEKLKSEIPMSRIGKPEDLDGITVFLASEASSYITGQSIHVDGGWTIW